MLHRHDRREISDAGLERAYQSTSTRVVKDPSIPSCSAIATAWREKPLDHPVSTADREISWVNWSALARVLLRVRPLARHHRAMASYALPDIHHRQSWRRGHADAQEELFEALQSDRHALVFVQSWS